MAGVGLFESSEHPEQRRLAGAIRASQADALAFVNLPADGVQQNTIAEGFRERDQLNHQQPDAGRTPASHDRTIAQEIST
jgi:hypothetical protein